ncbi:hypothetical protein BBBOND_0210760 [Babesia bigemina]|uniref:Uncharacterized protein n=1 Tax=Babesia bigemina TaxID=5866 RepID=A0A061D5E2_BABBI|nr:hypothetical protein BBBOND_0210760 [Babesia bigemina]CDR95926.1 hypothetical protein BBBOND_0210760 [Babesia bigemina]|eukprot:XP_012768112.1 hypothetical protein BBBOND_0210760 [Babesia bigemina]
MYPRDISDNSKVQHLPDLNGIMFNPNNTPAFNYVPQDPSLIPLQQAPQHVPMDPGYRNVALPPPCWPGSSPVPMQSPMPAMRQWQDGTIMMGGLDLQNQAFRSHVSYNTAPLVSTPGNQDMLNMEHLRPNLGTPPSGTNPQQLQPTPSPKSVVSGRGSLRDEPVGKSKGRVEPVMPMNKMLSEFEGPPITMFEPPRMDKPKDKKPYVPMVKQTRPGAATGPRRSGSRVRNEEGSGGSSATMSQIPTSKLEDFASKTFNNAVKSIAPPKIPFPWGPRPLVPPAVIDQAQVMNVAAVPQPCPPPMAVPHPNPLLPPPAAMLGIAPAVVPIPELRVQEGPLVGMDVTQPMTVPMGIPFDPNSHMPFPGPSVMTPVGQHKMPGFPMPSMGTAEGVPSADMMPQMRDPFAHITPRTPTIRVTTKAKLAPPVSMKSNMSVSGLSSASYPVQYAVTPAMGMAMPMDSTALGTPSPGPPPLGFAVNTAVPTPIATPIAAPVGMAVHTPLSMPNCIAPMVPITPGPLTISIQPPPIPTPQPAVQPPVMVPPPSAPANAGAVSRQPEESILDEIKKEKNVDNDVNKSLVSAPRIIVESYQQLLDKKRDRMRECLVEDCKSVLGERGKIDTPYQDTIQNGRKHFYVKDIVAKLLPYHMFYYENLEHKPKAPSMDLDALEERVRSLKSRVMDMVAQAKTTQQNYECTKACVDALRNVVRKRQATQCGQLGTT